MNNCGGVAPLFTRPSEKVGALGVGDRTVRDDTKISALGPDGLAREKASKTPRRRQETLFIQFVKLSSSKIVSEFPVLPGGGGDLTLDDEEAADNEPVPEDDALERDRRQTLKIKPTKARRYMREMQKR